jgi:beta-phosphoglucomutase-like phosphatase (HAD superfamily)
MITLKNTLENALQLAATLKVAKVVPVFDMDGVFADATHRQICNPDGSLNLDKYREMSTAEHINKDEELPLINALHKLQELSVPFHICTARVMCENTLAWLNNKGIKPKSIMARASDTDTRRDYHLKTTNLQSRFSHQQLKNMVLIDDNLANCQAAKKLGMNAINVPFEGH